MNDADGFPTVSVEELAPVTTTKPRVAVLHQRQNFERIRFRCGSSFS